MYLNLKMLTLFNAPQPHWIGFTVKRGLKKLDRIDHGAEGTTLGINGYTGN